MLKGRSHCPSLAGESEQFSLEWFISCLLVSHDMYMGWGINILHHALPPSPSVFIYFHFSPLLIMSYSTWLNCQHLGYLRGLFNLDLNSSALLSIHVIFILCTCPNHSSHFCSLKISCKLHTFCLSFSVYWHCYELAWFCLQLSHGATSWMMVTRHTVIWWLVCWMETLWCGNSLQSLQEGWHVSCSHRFCCSLKLKCTTSRHFTGEPLTIRQVHPDYILIHWHC